jgi:nitrogen fixation NifU-like protein
VHLRLQGDVIVGASFVTDGCGPSIACGSMLTKMIQGMSVAEAGEIEPEDLLRELDGLPDESVHCAELAVSTLQNALFNLAGTGGK